MAAAYEVLSDPERRNRFDRFGHTGRLDPGTRSPASATSSSRFFGGSGSPFGGEPGGARGRCPAGDLEAVIEVDFEDAVLALRQRFLCVPLWCANLRGDRCSVWFGPPDVW
ncbi:MAG: hypothetical protein CM1200mP26_17900 [Acidimicrobiales bacterium]|nr:MAG: hypothetical protein CM1200mP26_17900 [Acidimicrobiales bacterium]